MTNTKDSNVPPDYHIHTFLCNHAEGEVPEYRTAAKRQKIPQICFTDHSPSPDGYDPEHRMKMGEFSSYRDMIARMQDGKAPFVLFGVEADYYEGCEAFLKKWLPAQDFDLVIGSVHYIENWGFDNPDQRNVWDEFDVTDVWKTYFELVRRLACSGLFDIVGHLDLPKKFGHRPPDKDLKEMVLPTLDCIAEAGMGIEINTSGLRKPVGEIYPSACILSMACEREIPICFGSDAHRPEEVGLDFDRALELSRAAGYTHYFTIKQRMKKILPLPGKGQFYV